MYIYKELISSLLCFLQCKLLLPENKRENKISKNK